LKRESEGGIRGEDPAVHTISAGRLYSAERSSGIAHQRKSGNVDVGIVSTEGIRGIEAIDLNVTILVISYGLLKVNRIEVPPRISIKKVKGGRHACVIVDHNLTCKGTTVGENNTGAEGEGYLICA
jgi:hypothetical protein